MNKIKLFFGVACLVIAMGTALASNALTTVAPDYYYYQGLTDPQPLCYEITQTECQGGVPNGCTIDIPELSLTNVTVYDTRSDEFTCVTPLQRSVQ